MFDLALSEKKFIGHKKGIKKSALNVRKKFLQHSGMECLRVRMVHF